MTVSEVRETLHHKLLFEEPYFTGRIEFTIHCKDGGIGEVEAFSKNKIKNGNGKK